MKQKINKLKKGFTLMEILLVLVLLGIVFSIVGRKVFGVFFRGKREAAKLQIKQLEGNLDRYRLDCNFYPTTDQGLNSLIQKPSGGRQCNNYDPQGYLDGAKSIPKDPWGTDFTYTCDDGLHYVIKSLGADGQPGGEGDNADISNEEEK